MNLRQGWPSEGLFSSGCPLPMFFHLQLGLMRGKTSPYLPTFKEERFECHDGLKSLFHFLKFILAGNSTKYGMSSA